MIPGDGGEPALAWDSVGDGSDGPPLVLLHPLTATRDGVLHGSTRLERAGWDLVRYDARGHGSSEAPESPAGFTYEALSGDLERIVEATCSERLPVLVGSSMGAHTAVSAALRRPEGYSALVLIGPASEGRAPEEEELERWDSLADVLESGGIEGFARASTEDLVGIDPERREQIAAVVKRRMAAHRDLGAVSRAIREVPRSVPFQGMEALGAVRLPALVIGSHDEFDPGHPLAVAEAWAEAIPEAELAVEGAGESPIAWRGNRVCDLVDAFLRHRVAGNRDRVLDNPG